MWMLIRARPCTLSSSPELKDLSWLSSSPSPPPSSVPSVQHAPPPGAATDQIGPIYQLYRSVPLHSTTVSPVRAGANSRPQEGDELDRLALTQPQDGQLLLQEAGGRIRIDNEALVLSEGGGPLPLPEQ